MKMSSMPVVAPLSSSRSIVSKREYRTDISLASGYSQLKQMAGREIGVRLLYGEVIDGRLTIK